MGSFTWNWYANHLVRGRRVKQILISRDWVKMRERTDWSVLFLCLTAHFDRQKAHVWIDWAYELDNEYRWVHEVL